MGLLRLPLRSLTLVLAAALALVLAITFGRSLLDSLITRNWESASVHVDRSSFPTGVAPEVARDAVELIWRAEDGTRRRTLADRHAWSAFVRRTFETLETGRSAAQTAVADEVMAEIAPIEAAARARIARYADWYFAWPTTYRLLYEAGRSGLSHALTPRLISLEDAVAADVGDYLRRHYEEKVLEPEITDAKLRRAFARAYATAHDRYLAALAEVDAGFQSFVAEQTHHVRERQGEVAAAVRIDWQSQLRKLKTTSHEKGGIGAIAGAGGIAALAAAGGKTAPLAHASARAVGTRAAPARLWTRLALPVASRASGAAASAGGTGAIGAALAGPLGVAVGAGAGLLIDYGVNEGVELIERERFVDDVERAVSATFGEWDEAMQASLAGTVDVWFDDAIQLMGRFERDG
jgi:hypothetical protein